MNNLLSMLLQSVVPGSNIPRGNPLDPNLASSPAPPWAEPWLGEGAITGAVPTSAESPMPAKLSDAPAEMPANIMQSLAAPAGPDPRALVQPLPQVEAPRQRRSLLDTVGRISDVLATVGGSPPLYQPTLDAREDREIARGTQDMQRTLTQQQIETGEDTAEGRQRTMLGQAVRGLQAIQRRGGDINVAWPMLAARLQIPQDQVEELGRIFASDPNAVEGVAAALNEPGEFATAPTLGRDAQGNLRLYQLRRSGGATPVDLGDGITPVDPLQMVDLGGRVAGVGRNSGRPQIILPKTERPGQAADRQSRQNVAGAGRQSREGVARAGRESREGIARANRESRERIEAGTLTRTQRGNVVQLRESLPGVYRTLDRVEQLSRSLGAASGAIGGRIPGQLAGGTAAQFDRAQALLAAQIRSLIRTVGEGSMSDYESRLNIATLPARTDAPEGRAEAIRNLRALLGEMRARANRLLTQSSRASRPAGRRSTPRGNSGGSRSSGGWTVTRN